MGIGGQPSVAYWGHRHDSENGKSLLNVDRSGAYVFMCIWGLCMVV